MSVNCVTCGNIKTDQYTYAVTEKSRQKYSDFFQKPLEYGPVCLRCYLRFYKANKKNNPSTNADGSKRKPRTNKKKDAPIDANKKPPSPQKISAPIPLPSAINADTSASAAAALVDMISTLSYHHHHYNQQQKDDLSAAEAKTPPNNNNNIRRKRHADDYSDSDDDYKRSRSALHPQKMEVNEVNGVFLPPHKVAEFEQQQAAKFMLKNATELQQWCDIVRDLILDPDQGLAFIDKVTAYVEGDRSSSSSSNDNDNNDSDQHAASGNNRLRLPEVDFSQFSILSSFFASAPLTTDVVVSHLRNVFNSPQLSEALTFRLQELSRTISLRHEEEVLTHQQLLAQEFSAANKELKEGCDRINAMLARLQARITSSLASASPDEVALRQDLIAQQRRLEQEKIALFTGFHAKKKQILQDLERSMPENLKVVRMLQRLIESSIRHHGIRKSAIHRFLAEQQQFLDAYKQQKRQQQQQQQWQWHNNINNNMVVVAAAIERLQEIMTQIKDEVPQEYQDPIARIVQACEEVLTVQQPPPPSPSTPSQQQQQQQQQIQAQAQQQLATSTTTTTTPTPTPIAAATTIMSSSASPSPPLLSLSPSATSRGHPQQLQPPASSTSTATSTAKRFLCCLAYKSNDE